MARFINVAFVVCIFLALQSISLGFVDFFYYYIFMAISLPYLINKYKTVDKWLTVVLAYLIFIGMINVLLDNDGFSSLVKNVLGVFIAYWFYYLVIKHNDFDLEKLLYLYYRFAYYTALLGMVQFFSFLVGFKYGYDLSWIGLRVMGPSELGTGRFYPIHSIAGEPAAMGFLLAPAAYIAISRLSHSGFNHSSRKVAITILLSIILSQSSAAYFGIVISLLLVNVSQINFRTLVIAPTALCLTVFALYSISPKFQERLYSSLQLYSGSLILDAANSENSHGSSLILYNHFIIAIENASHHPFGSGIGSHDIAFKRYNTLQMWITGYGRDSIALNLHDASSLLNRIISEMGFVGLGFALWFICKNFVKITNQNRVMVLVNHSSLVSIMSALLRNGHYFVLGLPFFILCYYYSSKFSRESYLGESSTLTKQ